MYLAGARYIDIEVIDARLKHLNSVLVKFPNEGTQSRIQELEAIKAHMKPLAAIVEDAFSEGEKCCDRNYYQTIARKKQYLQNLEL